MIVIHPGMVKTATTSLQELVFARHPDITFLGLPAPSPATKAAIHQNCQTDDIDYDHQSVANVLRPLAAEARDGVAVLSYENFALYESKDKGLVAERLHQHARLQELDTGAGRHHAPAVEDALRQGGAQCSANAGRVQR